MKLTTTSLTALVLSAADVQGTWWNSKINNNGPITAAEITRSHNRYLWNQPPKFYQNKINTFKRPIIPQNVNTYSPQPAAPVSNDFNPEYNTFLEKALQNDHIRSSRPVPGPYDINTSKVKVRVAIQYNCGGQHTPSISSVQDRVNKDYVIRQLIGKKFSAVHVNRFKCNTPFELFADFIFYVYEEDKLGFPEILDSLKPSLCRATGIHHTDMAKTIRILPEQEIIEEAVNQVSTSISKAIATIGHQQKEKSTMMNSNSEAASSIGQDLDASNIVDVAVNNIIEQDSTSVNNIVEDLVSVINSDREEVVSDLVAKVEDQIRKELNQKNTERTEVDETVKLVTEAMIEEAALPEEIEEAEAVEENEIVAGILAASEAPSTEAFESTNILDPVIIEEEGEQEDEDSETVDFTNEGDINEFLSDFVNLPDASILDAIVENMQIQEEEEEVKEIQEDDLKAVLLEVTQAPSLQEEEMVSARDIVNAIMPDFIEESLDEVEEESETITETETETLTESEARNEFMDSLLATDAQEPEAPAGQAASPTPEDLANETGIDEVVSSILSVDFSEQPIRSSEEENEIVSSILDASEQVVQSPEISTQPEELTSTVEIIEQTPEDEVDAFDLFEDISDLIKQEPSTVEDASAHAVLDAVTSLAGEETEGAGESPILETSDDVSISNNSTNINFEAEIPQNLNSTSIEQPRPSSEIESIIEETESSLIDDNIIDNVLSSLVVEVPEDLVSQLALERANGTSLETENARSRSLDLTNDDDQFVNGVVESVMRFFSS